MKRKILSLALTLALSAGLTAPVFAAPVRVTAEPEYWDYIADLPDYWISLSDTVSQETVKGKMESWEDGGTSGTLQLYTVKQGTVIDCGFLGYMYRAFQLKDGTYAFDEDDRIVLIHPVPSMPPSDSYAPITLGPTHEGLWLVTLGPEGRDFYLKVLPADSGVLQPPADTGSQTQKPVWSTNIDKNTYSTYGETVTSYLYANEKGGLTRVELQSSSNVLVEDYDSSFHYLSGRTVTRELPIWGGFFAGKDYNFLIEGQNNPHEDDSVEVLRVVKYSKDWIRLGSASLYGGRTKNPISHGSLRCAESDGYLYIHTCHTQYKSSDGLNHQCSMPLVVREGDMTLLDLFTFDSPKDGVNSTSSHSFNQFILVDQQKRVVTLDHGDGSPRAASIECVRANPENGYSPRTYALVQEFPGAYGDNTTGASLGGLAETTNGYVIAYNFDQVGGGGNRYVYLGYANKNRVEKNRMESTTIRVSSSTGGTPVLASTGLDGGYMMWRETYRDEDGFIEFGDNIHYVRYDANGNVGPERTAPGALSDCQPISYNGKLVWYVTNKSTPVFYGLDGSGITVLGGDPSQLFYGTDTPDPTNPTQPEKPSTVKTANPTNDKLTVNGAAQNPTVYKIGGSNYFKIRDVAAVLNGTEKQFSVGYSGGKVTADSGKPYEMTGTELKGAPAASGSATPSNDKIVIDGVETDVTVYKIGGANYFKLRDLGKALNFYVGWTAGKGVYIETDKPYSE